MPEATIILLFYEECKITVEYFLYIYKGTSGNVTANT